MLNTSSEWKTAIREERKLLAYVDIELDDGTILKLDNTHLRGFKLEDSTSQSGELSIGSAIINKLSVQIDNVNSEYNYYNFENAIIRPSIGLQLYSNIETLHKGVYIVDSAISVGGTISITALDYMCLFDYNYSDSTLNYPATVLQIMQEICTRHGIFFKTSSFHNSGFIVDSKPDTEALTDREMISYCAQIAGNNARFDINGDLEFIWYDISAFEQNDNLDGGIFDSDNPYSSGDNADGGNFTDYNSGDTYDGGTFLQMNKYHHIYSLKNYNVAVDDVVITGIQVTDSSEDPTIQLVGTLGYVLSIEKNPLIQSAAKALIVAATVGSKLIGMRFRPMYYSAVSDPSREACDVAYVSDRKGNSYQTLITTIAFTIGAMDSIRCDAETPSRNSSKRYSANTKTYIQSRNETKKQIREYDIAVQRLTNLMTNSFGVFKTEEVLEDGSTVFYMHDKPTLAESQTIWKMTADALAVSTDGGLTWNAGFDSEGNAVVNVLSAIGIVADWVKTGILVSSDNSVQINLDNGNFTFKDSNGQALLTPNGVANSDNFQATDNIASGYPLRMPFNIDDSVSIITSVKLKWTIDKFRTYSTGSSSGGGGSTTSSTDESIIFAETYSGNFSTSSGGGSATTTGNTVSSSGVAHNHTYSTPSHDHIFSMPHTHGINVTGHDHSVYFSPHNHGVSYGILETDVTAIECKVLVDGVERATISTMQGEIDLSTWITTPGWHTIEITSTTLKRVSAQVNIKSYIRR